MTLMGISDQCAKLKKKTKKNAPLSSEASRPGNVIPKHANLTCSISIPHLSFQSALFLIILFLFFAVCPDGEASCSHNAVVIPPAHGALTLVNTLPIVS